MNKQRGAIPAFLIPYLWKAAAGLVIAVVLGFLVHKYNESIRAPLKKEIKFLTDSIEANKKQAAQMLAQREAENKKAVEGYIELARKSDADYTKQIADIRARANTGSGLRLNIPECGNSGNGAGQTGQGGAQPSQAAATAGQLLREFIGLALSESSRADEVSAYAESCHRFVNGK